MANITNQSLYDSLLARSLQALPPMDVIADVSGMKNSPLFYIIAKLNKGKSKQWNYEKYEYSTMGNRSIIATITGVSASGLNLVVTYTGTGTVDPFRTNWIVLDANLKKGRIILHSLGSVTIEPDGSALSAATDFQPGTFLKNGWNASTNRESRKTEDLKYVPDSDSNFAAVSRNTTYIDLEDQINSRPQIKGNSIWYGQEQWGIQDWVKQLSLRWLVDERAQVTGWDGMRNTNGGCLWSILNRNGQVIPSTAIFTLADMQDIIMGLRLKDATPDLNIACFLGSSVLGEIQKAIGGTAIQYAGVDNTYGVGALGGINVEFYKYLGATLRFYSMPEFDNAQGLFADPVTYNPGTTKGNNSALFINTNELPAEGGGTVPCVELFHRGNCPVYYKHIPGMIEAGKSVEVADFTEPVENSNTSSDLPGRTALMYTFSGINIRDAKGMVYWKG